VQLNTSVGAFTSVETNNANIKVIIETGAAAHSINILIDDNLAKFFKWKLEGSALKLLFDLSGGKYPRWLPENDTDVTLKAPAVDTVSNNGTIEINLQYQLTFN